MKKTAGLLIVALTIPAWGQGRKPEEKPKTESSSHPAQSAKDSANQVLNATDQGIHKALGAAKDGANEALGAVDKGVHKIVGSDKK